MKAKLFRPFLAGILALCIFSSSAQSVFAAETSLSWNSVASFLSAVVAALTDSPQTVITVSDKRNVVVAAQVINSLAGDGTHKLIDATLVSLRDGSHLYFYNSTDRTLSKYEGTYDDPFRTNLWTKSSMAAYPDPKQTNPENPYWLLNTYEVPDGVLAFIHVEVPKLVAGVYLDDNCCEKGRIGLAWSKDKGETFGYLGNIVVPNDDFEGFLVTGGPYIIRNGYFYFYYHDSCIAGKAANTVIRAPVDEVLAAARAGDVSPWMKYNNGKWDGKGIGGPCTGINQPPATATDAVYSTYDNTYYMVQTQLAFPGNENKKTTWVKLYRSKNGIDWKYVKTVGEESRQDRIGYQYASLLDVDGVKDGTVGKRFYVYSPWINVENNPAVFRWTIDLDIPINTPPADLKAGDVTPVTSISGEPTKLNATINNKGGTPTGKTFANRFDIDNDTNHSSVAATAPGSSLSLAPDASEETKTDFTFPSPGTWFVRAVVDTLNEVTESNEGNNAGAWTKVVVTAPVVPLFVSCSGSPTAVVKNENVTWSAISLGGTGAYTYLWAGSVEGTSSSVQKNYATTGSKKATVTVTSGSASKTVGCGNVVEVSERPIIPVLEVSCSANPTKVSKSENVTWSAVAQGGLGTYTYAWTGSESLSGTSVTVAKNYSALGTKTASVSVTSGTASKTVACTNSVEVSQTSATPLTVSCSPTPETITAGGSVTWTAVVSGGTDPYTYTWSGTSALKGTTASVPRVYNSAGLRSASVVVTSGTATKTATCSQAQVLPEPYVFSTGYKSVQGGQKWYYEYKTGNAYTPMTWGLHPTIPTAEVWRGNERYLLISRGSMHPGDNSDAVLKWVAPYAGSVSVTGKAYDGDTTCGDGASAQVLKNGTSLWQETITDATGKSHSLTQTVAEGDALYFIVKKGGNSSCDTTKWDPTITYTSISK